MQIVKLDAISIAPSAASVPKILHLKQCFTFPTSLKPSKEISTQTSQLNFACATSSQRFMKRPSSLPPENVALINLENRVQPCAQSNIFKQSIGDGVDVSTVRDGDEMLKNGFRLPDMELADCITPMPVQRVIVQPK
jgi:hypothetical protein